MPKTKQKSGRTAHDVDSDDDYGLGKLGQESHRRSTSSSDDLERKINELVQYLLIIDQKKQIIKKTDINSHVLRESKKLFPVIMAGAKKKLQTIFGISVVELEDKQKNSCILVNALPIDRENPHIKWTDEEYDKYSLLVIILSLVFMNGNVMQDSLMWHTLKKIGVDPDSIQHEVFRDVKKLITQEFVRQGYLEYIRQPNTDPPAFEFWWGQRAKHEVSKRSILDFVSQVYEMNPQQWTSQWQDVERSENSLNGHMN